MAWLPYVALLALTVAAPLPAPPSADPSTRATDGELIESSVDRVERMTVPTAINGRGPYAFTIDTGADRSAVSDRLAAELALPAGADVTMHSVVGTKTVATVDIDRIRLGRSERRAIRAPVLPEDSLGATGFLGTDMLAGHTVVLDFARNRMQLDRSTRIAAQADSARGDIVVNGRSRFGQLILTDARIRGIKVYAIIDTGAQYSVGNPVLRRLLLGQRPIREQGRIVGVAGGSIPCEAGVVPRINFGEMRLANMPLLFADAATFHRLEVDTVPAILVGMDMLRGFGRVAVDFGRREVRFRV